MTDGMAGDVETRQAEAAWSSLPSWAADGILYVLDVPAFRDSDGDGLGDLRGVEQGLDEIAGLGVTMLWLLPFYASPRQDNGYDVADHFAVDARLGTMDDLRSLIDAAHRRGLRIIIDLLANHVSSQHLWFQAATAPGTSAMRDRFVWTTDPTSHRHLTPVFPGFEESVWQYEHHVGAWYLHHFYEFEPDLNSRHEAVRNYVRDVITFWLEMGIDGFRLDAAPFLGDDLSAEAPDPHAYLKQMRSWIDAVNPEACLFAEADLPADQLSAYFGDGDEVHGLFDFMLNRHVYLALAEEAAGPVRKALQGCPPVRAGQGWVSFLRHHDELSLSFLDRADQQKIFDRFAPEPSMQIYERGIRRRLAPLLENDWDLLRGAFSLQMSLPAVPMIMFGDELGLPDNLQLPERAAVRTPMAWEEPGATPSRMLLANIVAKEAVPVSVEVPGRRAGADDFRTWLADLIALRKQVVDPVKPSFEVIESGSPAVLAHRYAGQETSLLCLHNFSGQAQHVRLEDDLPAARVVLGEGQMCCRERRAGTWTLEPHGFRWVLLDTGTAAPGEKGEPA